MKADRPGIEPATCNRKSNACATTPLYRQCCLHLTAGQTCSVLGAEVPLQIQIIYFVWRLASIYVGLKPESYTVAVSRYTKPAFHPSPGIGLDEQDSKSSVSVCLDRCSCVLFCVQIAQFYILGQQLLVQSHAFRVTPFNRLRAGFSTAN